MAGALYEDENICVLIVKSIIKQCLGGGLRGNICIGEYGSVSSHLSSPSPFIPAPTIVTVVSGVGLGPDMKSSRAS